MRRAGFGVIGVGIWGENHVRAFTQNPQANLIAIADINESRAKLIAKQYNIKKYYTNYKDLLENPEIEAVGIATPDFSHVEPCVDAANAGKHILVEKPLATNVQDAKKIVDAAKKNNIKLMVDFHNRWNPSCILMKEAIENGDIGDPLYLYARLNNTKLSPTEFLKWASKSKVIWFLMVHTCDLARWFFNDEVKRVYAISRSKVLEKIGINTPDFYASIIEFKNGPIANFESCWIIPNTIPGVGWGQWQGLGIDFELELIGSNGAVYANLFPNFVIRKYTDNNYNWPDIQGTFQSYGKWIGYGLESIHHFIDCVVNDKEPIVTGEDGLAATKIICAIEESAKNGKIVEL
jgi:predicted dehydrogenase